MTMDSNYLEKMLPNTTVRKILKWVAAILLITAATGFAVDYALFIIMDFAKEAGPLHSYKVAFVYTTSITLCNLATKKWLDHNYQLRSPFSVFMHVLVQTVSVVIGFLMATYLSSQLFHYPGDESLWTDEVQQRAMVIVVLVSFFAAFVINSFWYGYAFFKRMLAMERAYNESRMSALRAQINPHFLFNSLNSIASLIRVNPQKAENLTEDLADLFRFSLQSSKKQVIRLEEEFESVETYLEIEKARFGERILPEIDLPEELKYSKVPSFILQPLVENAVKHGVAKTDQPCRIAIKARDVGGMLSLTVDDTGPGFEQADSELILANGTGLANVKDRLEAVYAQQGNLMIHPQGVELQMPLAKEESSTQKAAVETGH